MSREFDRAADLRAIAEGRVLLNVRNGVTVSRSMLARIADEFETMSTALAAKDAELAAVHQRYVDANEARIDAEAQLAEANKAQKYLNDAIFAALDDQEVARRARFLVQAARRTREQGGNDVL
jgi:hypothetical protein